MFAVQIRDYWRCKMKAVTLTDVIKKECKNKNFAQRFQHELLINEIAKLVVQLRQSVNLTQYALAKNEW